MPSAGDSGLFSPMSGADIDVVDVDLFSTVASRRPAIDRRDVASHVVRGGARVGGNGLDREGRLPSGRGGPIGEVFNSELRSETLACPKAATTVESFAPPAVDYERSHANRVAVSASAQDCKYPHGGGFFDRCRAHPVDDVDRTSELELRDIGRLFDIAARRDARIAHQEILNVVSSLGGDARKFQRERARTARAIVSELYSPPRVTE